MLQHNSLLSVNKFAEANYLTVFTPDGLKIFDEDKTKLSSTEEPILQGCWDPTTGLWRILMHSAQHSPDNLMPNTINMGHMRRQYAMMNNVYELPCTRQIIRYYHATAGFLTKVTWLKAI